MVFETQIRDLMNKYLGQIIEGVNEEDLELNLIKGLVKLDNLTLRPEFINDMDLPITLVSGSIGSLYIRIDWTHLLAAPLVFEIEKVYLFVEPKDKTKVEFDAKKEIERALKRKLSELETEETKRLDEEQIRVKLLKNRTLDPNQLSKASLIIGHLAGIGAGTVHLSVQDIHICVCHPTFANPDIIVGIAIEELSLTTTTKEFKEAFTNLTLDTYQKAQLKGFCVYVNNEFDLRALPHKHANLLLRPPTAKQIARSRQMEYQYLIRPIDCDVNIAFNKNLIPAIRMFLSIHTPDITVQLTRSQYTALMALIEQIMDVQKRLTEKKERYDRQVNSREADENEIKRYTTLYKRSLNALWLPALSEYEVEQKKKIEEEVAFDDLSTLRMVALAEVRAQLSPTEPVQLRDTALNSKIHWWDKLLGRTETVKQKIQDNAEPENELTDNDEEAILYSIVNEKEQDHSPTISDQRFDPLKIAGQLSLDITFQLTVGNITFELIEELNLYSSQIVSPAPVVEKVQTPPTVPAAPEISTDFSEMAIYSESVAPAKSNDASKLKPLLKFSIDQLAIQARITESWDIQIQMVVHAVNLVEFPNGRQSIVDSVSGIRRNEKEESALVKDFSTTGREVLYFGVSNERLDPNLTAEAQEIANLPAVNFQLLRHAKNQRERRKAYFEKYPSIAEQTEKFLFGPHVADTKRIPLEEQNDSKTNGDSDDETFQLARTQTVFEINNLRFSFSPFLLSVPKFFVKPDDDEHQSELDDVIKEQHQSCELSSTSTTSEIKAKTSLDNASIATVSTCPQMAQQILTKVTENDAKRTEQVSLERQEKQALIAEIDKVQKSLEEEQNLQTKLLPVDASEASSKAVTGPSTESTSGAVDVLNQMQAVINAPMPAASANSTPALPPRPESAAEPIGSLITLFSPICVRIRVRCTMIQVLSNDETEEATGLCMALDIGGKVATDLKNKITQGELALNDAKAWTQRVVVDDIRVSQTKINLIPLNDYVIRPFSLTVSVQMYPSNLMKPKTSIKSDVFIEPITITVPTRVYYLFTPLLEKIVTMTANSPRLGRTAARDKHQQRESIEISRVLVEKEKKEQDEDVMQVFKSTKATISKIETEAKKSGDVSSAANTAERGTSLSASREYVEGQKQSSSIKNANSYGFGSVDVNLHMKQLAVEVWNDLFDVDLPLIRFVIPEVTAALDSFGHQRSIRVTISDMAVDFYNPDFNSWEPIIEPCSWIATLQQTYAHPLMAVVNASNAKVNQYVVAIGESKTKEDNNLNDITPPITTTITIIADRVMDLTASHAAVKEIVNVLNVFMETHDARKQLAKAGKVIHIASGSSYVVENFTQLVINFTALTKSATQNCVNELVSLAPYHAQNFNFDARIPNDQHSVQLVLKGGQQSIKIPLNNVGSYLHSVDLIIGNATQRVGLVVDIFVNANHSKVIRLRSSIGVHNRNKVPIELNDLDSTIEASRRTVVKPDFVHWLPLQIGTSTTATSASVAAGGIVGRRVQIRQYTAKLPAEPQLVELANDSPYLNYKTTLVVGQPIPLLLCVVNPTESSSYKWSEAIILQPNTSVALKCEHIADTMLKDSCSWGVAVHAHELTANSSIPRSKDKCELESEINQTDEALAAQKAEQNNSAEDSVKRSVQDASHQTGDLHYQNTKTKPKLITGYVYCITPPLIIDNLLASDVNIRVSELIDNQPIEKWSANIPRGDTQPINSSLPDSTLLLAVGCQKYGCHYANEPIKIKPQDLSSNKEHIHQLKLHTNKGQELIVNCGIKRLDALNSLHIYLYARYWIFDLTGIGLIMSGDKNHLIPRVADLDYKNAVSQDEQHAIMCSNDSIYFTCLGLRTDQWSKSINLAKAVTATELTLPGSSAQAGVEGTLELNIIKEKCRGRFKRTQLITITPRYFVINQLDFPIDLRQPAAKVENLYQRIQTEEQVAFHWTSSSAAKTLSFLPEHPNDTTGWLWSGEFDPNVAGRYVVQLRHCVKVEETFYVVVQISDQKGMKFITLSQPDHTSYNTLANVLPYRIENQSLVHTIRFRQHTENRYPTHEWLQVLPGGIRPFASEYPELDSCKIVVETADYSLEGQLNWNRRFTVDLGEIRDFGRITPQSGNEASPVFACVDSVEAAQVLIVRHTPLGQTTDLTTQVPDATALDALLTVAQLLNKLQKIDRLIEELQAGINRLMAEKSKSMARLASISFSQQTRPPQLPGSKRFLSVQILSAKSVPTKYDIIYLKVQLNNDQKSLGQTDPVKNSSIIRFHDHFLSQTNESGNIVRIELWQKKLLGLNSRQLGHAELQLSELDALEPVEKWVPLLREKNGELQRMADIQLVVRQIPESSQLIASRVKELEKQILTQKNKLESLKKHHLQLRRIYEQKRRDASVRGSVVTPAETTIQIPNASKLSQFKLRLQHIRGLQALLLAQQQTVSRLVCIVKSNITPYQASIVVADLKDIKLSGDDFAPLPVQEIVYYTSESLIMAGESLSLSFYAYARDDESRRSIDELNHKWSDDQDKSSDQYTEENSLISSIEWRKLQSDIGFRPMKPFLIAHANVLLSSLPVATIDRDTDVGKAQSHAERMDILDKQEMSAVQETNKEAQVSKGSESTETQACKKEEHFLKTKLQDYYIQRTVVAQASGLTIPSENVTLPGLECDFSLSRIQISIDEALFTNLPLAIIQISLPGVGLSIVDSHPTELLYFSILGIEAGIQKSTSNVILTAGVNKLQLDNQTPDAIYPVILSHTPIGLAERPFLEAAVSVQLIDNPNLKKFDYVSLSMLELDIKSEESILWQGLEFAQTALKSDKGSSIDDTLVFKRYSAVLQPKLPSTGSEMAISVLRISPIKIKLTFEPRSGLRQSLLNLGDFDIFSWIGSFTGSLVSIHDAHIILSGKLISHIRGMTSTIIKTLLSRYQTELVFQILKVAGSVDLIAAPVSTVTKIGTGLKEFITEPIKGAQEGDLGGGLARGIAAPITHSVSAVGSLVGNLSNNLSKGAAAVSLDRQYALEQQRINAPETSVSEGAKSGMESLVHGVSSGVRGLVTAPQKGFEKEGFIGGIKGAARGVVGVVAKPVAGAVGAVGQTAIGLQYSADSVDRKHTANIGIRPVRERRLFERSGKISKYVPDQSDIRKDFWTKDV